MVIDGLWPNYWTLLHAKDTRVDIMLFELILFYFQYVDCLNLWQVVLQTFSVCNNYIGLEVNQEQAYNWGN